MQLASLAVNLAVVHSMTGTTTLALILALQGRWSYQSTALLPPSVDSISNET